MARDIFPFLPLPEAFDWNDGRRVVDKIATLDSPVPDVPPLVVYATRLSHEVGPAHSVELGRWADVAGQGAGLSEGRLRRLLVEIGPAGRDLNLPPPPHAAHYADKSRVPDTDAQSEDSLSSLSTLPGSPALAGSTDSGRIWGNVPPRNPDFTGREGLLLNLQRSLEAKNKASVLPHALHGSGGVGKTQLAVEFAYRFGERYDLVWWVPAEQQTLVLQSLAELGQKLGIPGTQEFTQAASLVIEALARTDKRWLLVFDNANDPTDLDHLIPSSGGHVILTSRNPAWLDVWDAVKVDVFDRPESIELVQRRGTNITEVEADRLAAKLGDLPLALDQAASWQTATAMTITEYLSLFDQHFDELSARDRDVNYPLSIAALVKLALERLQRDAPAVAQLLEMFAVFGAEPISVGLLRRGRLGTISQPLARALRDSTAPDRMARDLRKYGLAKVDVENRIQVHRLLQVALRDILDEELLDRGRTNVHRLLGAANPGEPDDDGTRELHAEIAPHVNPSGLINSAEEDGRRTVLDQIRYLWNIGDYDGSRRLGQAAVDAWVERTDQPDLGPDGELTLLASRHLSNALLSLGINGRARELAESTLARLRKSPEFGPDHEHTLWTAATVAVALRVAGEFKQALALEQENVDRYVRVFGAEDATTLRNQGNLAVNLRMLSDFPGAFKIDDSIVLRLDETLTEDHRRLLFAQSNLVRDLYGLGKYEEALQLQGRILPIFRRTMNDARHPMVLLASRTLAMALRKTGRYDEALQVARENYHDCVARYGEAHEHALAATMTYANTLRVGGSLSEARGLAVDAVARYRRTFGDLHPLTLVAQVNEAVIQRSIKNLDEAHRLDVAAHRAMIDILGADHGYTLCAASGLANDLALLGDDQAAHRLSSETLAISQRSRGPEHPYTLLCAVNATFDRIAVGETTQGEEELASVVGALSELLGTAHPETLGARLGRRAECDIEPPPT
ncbi:FxSxx-COOH system tetratricopeptide repeat protein [Actinoplanes sp. TRM 88003]|uniref:FxSxx-COOH system tetratricopeptide repeat protein n=1 Tax=Paractinoplanes aksuensis TaxID=2939490 RepID=A0ABT1DDX1_9ACTN|nr:FxSxx-COOH system tetratricopeptide repeat protein [Actinoplanes aksuensis]MCO8269009.1 FxSxx-COOH system tetratricopeptide repeat protein [Actinoplanes aksuensis]